MLSWGPGFGLKGETRGLLGFLQKGTQGAEALDAIPGLGLRIQGQRVVWFGGLGFGV